MRNVSQISVAAAQRAGRSLWNLPQQTLIALLTLYRRIVSPLYGPVCRFFPSCSAYALEAIVVHGAVKGSWYGTRRLLRCHPWNQGGVDHVPGGGKHWDDPRKTPRIVVLNHPLDSGEDGRAAAGA